MLSDLPFPKNLRRVTEWAGAHHEKMDGTGYPRGLKRDDMSVPARIMAIADIFEALTAVDRPYKSPKTLTQCLSIMKRMSEDEKHIDPDLFALFLTSGVYRDYAEQFLRTLTRLTRSRSIDTCLQPNTARLPRRKTKGAPKWVSPSLRSSSPLAAFCSATIPA